VTNFDPSKHERGGDPKNTGRFSRKQYTGAQWDLPSLNKSTPQRSGDVHGVPDVGSEDLAHLVSDIEPKGVGRARQRFAARRAQRIFGDAAIEGNTFTEPEVQTLLEEKHVPGHTDGEVFQIKDLERSNKYLLTVTSDQRPLPITQSLSDDFHVFLAAHTGISTLEFRGDVRGGAPAPRVGLGRGRRFHAIPTEMTREVFDQGAAEIQQIEHPVLRGATWASFASYHQFYLDGNKRAARYTMNAILVSHGYDSIDIPASSREAYLESVIETMETGDLTPGIRFLLSLYDDA